MHACVLGAGIVGLATAYALQRQGWRVTVIDQGPVGGGASGGNGAQLSYSYVQPLADASVWGQLPKLLFSPDSPLKLRPQWSVHQWRWGAAFLAACNDDTSRRTTGALLALAARSRLAFDALLDREGLACDFTRTGKLVVYRSREALAAAERQMALQREWGSEQESVSAARCVELEPALAHDAAGIAGAIHTPSECAADCRKVCEGLHALLAARGVQFILGARVSGFLRDARGAVSAVRVQRGAGTEALPVEADHFVLALGSDSTAWAERLGMRVPVYPLKGYSITLDAPAGAAWAPHVNVTDASRKVVFARIGDRLRVAGMAELVGDDRSIPPDRIARLRATVSAVFGHDPGDGADLRPWTGMRPATPTGLPIVGRQPGGPANLWLHTGHGALGFTLSFGTAEQLAEALAQERRPHGALAG
ncbi:D-amino acid dehydrogenase [Acidovorax sp. NCPPB 4044]|uniref:D-amino acid dehydrogenase n=1 Tax=Acidovorax sp. NCPPB 4044 TaxID=2940490 RepID=UPI002302938C|nr:D-amino acid dehydrogenase [Acidovorax sp. NCPPB 4044]MDA8521769.1 D-amino acid dehydrogenase [Acidovorax sp. NCPPB 4044]